MYQILLLETSDVEWDFSELDEVEFSYKDHYIRVSMDKIREIMDGEDCFFWMGQDYSLLLQICPINAEDIDEAFHENWDDKLAELDEKEDGDL